MALIDGWEAIQHLDPQPVRSDSKAIARESAALGNFEAERGLDFPDLYKSVVTEFQALFFGEAASPLGSPRRWVHESPISMFVFAVDTDIPLRRPSRSMEGNEGDLKDAFDQLLGPGHDALDNALVAICGDSHGWFCFDFSFDADEPPIVFVDPEQDWYANPATGLRFVAEGFSQFLTQLEYPNEFGEYPTPSGSTRPPPAAEQRWNAHRDQSLLAQNS